MTRPFGSRSKIMCCRWCRSNASHLAPDEPVNAMQNPEITESGAVDLDTEMVKLTKNSIEYQYMVTMLNKKFTMLKTAITEGGN